MYRRGALNSVFSALLALAAAFAMLREASAGVGYPVKTVPTRRALSLPPEFPVDPAELAPGIIGATATRWIAEAYPDRIDERAVRDGEWALRIGEQWFHWANGRLMPESERDDAHEYSAMRFYDYRLGEHEVADLDEEAVARMRARYDPDVPASEQRVPRGRNPAFYEALYGFSDRLTADRAMERLTFLGRVTRVHPMVVDPLLRVVEEIFDLMDSDDQVRSFVTNISQVSGFYWRDIFGSASRSYHSYGTAIDLLPRTYRGGFGYWRWAQRSGIDEWWSLPLDRRHTVPQQVVDAFERHGFVWGGKWIGFDPIHFEYRPEVIQYARERDVADSVVPPLE